MDFHSLVTVWFPRARITIQQTQEAQANEIVVGIARLFGGRKP